jgi:hypothetical protein
VDYHSETPARKLQATVAVVKQASDEKAARVDKLIAALQGAGDGNPVIAQAIADVGQTAAALRAFHADTPVAG